LAEKLGITQITYIEELVELNGKNITVRRNIGNGFQQVKTKLPVLLTVTDKANEPRVAAAKRIMKYKNARTPIEVQTEVRRQKTEDRSQKTEDRGQKTEGGEEKIRKLVEQQCDKLRQKGLLIEQWDLKKIDADLSWCGRGGSPTKVHRIRNVVLAAKDSKEVAPDDKGIAEMIHELIEDKTIS